MYDVDYGTTYTCTKIIAELCVASAVSVRGKSRSEGFLIVHDQTNKRTER